MDPELPARLLIEALREGRSARFVVRGASMWPAIRDGSRVEVTPCAPGSLRPGEVAAFARGHRIYVHRVVRRTREGLVFRGDALAADDGAVPDDAVLGRVRVIAGAGWRVRRPTLLDAVRVLRAGSARLRCWWSECNP